MIPQTLHQVWVGPRPAPLRYINQWREVCQQYGWEHRLWDDDQVDREVRFTRSLYDRETSYCQRANLYRLEVLYRHGGIYIDADTIPTGSDPSAFLPLQHTDLLGTCEHHFPLSEFSQQMWDNAHDPIPDDLCPLAIVLLCGFIAAAPRHPQVLIWLKALAAGTERARSAPQDEPLGHSMRVPTFCYVMSRHLFYPITIVPFSMLTGKPDSFAEWPSILPAECYSLKQWQDLKRVHPHLTDIHPDEIASNQLSQADRDSEPLSLGAVSRLRFRDG